MEDDAESQPTVTLNRGRLDSAIQIRGARTHNLKSVDVDIPRNQLTVITGRSGSGKSSLAFDTLYAEGQRQYIESLSIYSRQFFTQMPRADVDQIIGLQPTLCLDQNHRAANRRATVATVTEVYDYLRVLLARVGEIRCHQCQEPIRQQTPQQIRDTLLRLPERTKVMILAPLVSAETGDHPVTIQRIRRERLVRLRIDGELHDIDRLPVLDRKQPHSIEAVTDRIIVRPGIEGRLLEAIDLAIRLSGQDQVIACWTVDGKLESSGSESSRSKSSKSEGSESANPGTPDQRIADGWAERLFSTRYACPDCDVNYAEVEPRTFSFNSPLGACGACEGLGSIVQFDESLIVDRARSVNQGAVLAWNSLSPKAAQKNVTALAPLLAAIQWTADQPLAEMSAQQWQAFLDRPEKGSVGLRWLLRRELATTPSEARQIELEQLEAIDTCERCRGSRVSTTALAVFLAGKNIAEITAMSIDAAHEYFNMLYQQPQAHGIEEEEKRVVAKQTIGEILQRLKFLQKVGVGYLTLGRAANTLSGGEHQRVRLASSIGTGVTNVCFVLDEPSIGLHQRDNDRLIEAIGELREAGNTVVVVEHDEEMMRQADYIVDVGPGAGAAGGRIVASGSPSEIVQQTDSLTGKFLSGNARIETPLQRRPVDIENSSKQLRIVGARGNNLKEIDVEIPLGVFCCVTGVSGSGKSTLINQTLAPALARALDLVAPTPAVHTSIDGAAAIDKLILVDQQPIGRTPRACPATFTGVFDEIRKLFAATKLAKQRGYGVGRFSFNAKTGWCPQCQGHGVKRVAMNFMPDIFVTCETCQGGRFNLQTLQVRFGELSIADVLQMPIDAALVYFDGFSKIRSILQSVADVGLGYLLLGQASTTLSGGEAQRLKLARELARPNTGNTLYILDEPTTGLHFEDIRVLIGVLNRLIDQGNSMLVIEHNLDVIRSADWIIDLGPEGGSGGGELLGCGSPETIATLSRSHTGRYLQQLFARES